MFGVRAKSKEEKTEISPSYLFNIPQVEFVAAQVELVA